MSLYFDLDPGVSLTVNNSIGHDYTFAGFGRITGVAQLLKKGSGTLSVSNTGVNDFSGGTTISQGTVVASLGNFSHALGSGPITLGDANTGASDVALYQTGSGAGTYKLTNPIFVNAQGSGSATIGVTSPSAGNFYEYAGVLTLNRPTTLTSGGTVANTQLTYSGGITGPVGLLTVTGGNMIIFAASSTFTGNIATNGTGTVLSLQDTLHNDAIPDTSSIDVGAGAQLFISDSSESIDGLSGSGTIAGNNLTIGAGGGSGTLFRRFSIERLIFDHEKSAWALRP